MNKKALAAKKLREMTRLAIRRRSLLEQKKLRDNPARGIAVLLEGDLEQAEIALAIQSMEDDIQGIAEKVAKMSVEEVMPLADRIREQFGTDKAEAFDTAANDTLSQLLDAAKETREALSLQSLIIQGKADASEMSDMATDDPDEMASGDDMDLDLGDEDEDGGELDDLFGGSDEASGPEDEALGRAKKESRNNTKKIVESKKKIFEDPELTELIKLIKEADNDLERELLSDRYGYLYEEVQEYIKVLEEEARVEKLRKIHTPGSAMREALKIEEGIGDIIGKAAQFVPGPIGMAAKAAGMLGAFDGDDDTKNTPQTPNDIQQDQAEDKLKRTPAFKTAMDKVSTNIAKDPKVNTLAKSLGVDPKSAAELVTNSINYTTPMLEHAIVEMTDDSEMRESEAVDLLKTKMSAARSGKSIAETEAFDGGITLSTPKSVMKQLTKKYGSPDGWQIAENDEGGYYVISERIPETLRAKEIEKMLETLDAESANLREEYGDLDEDYQLPQEIRATKLREQLKELVQGYHHPVARWCTMDEARSIVALGRRWFGKQA